MVRFFCIFVWATSVKFSIVDQLPGIHRGIKSGYMLRDNAHGRFLLQRKFQYVTFRFPDNSIVKCVILQENLQCGFFFYPILYDAF